MMILAGDIGGTKTLLAIFDGEPIDLVKASLAYDSLDSKEMIVGNLIFISSGDDAAFCTLVQKIK